MRKVITTFVLLFTLWTLDYKLESGSTGMGERSHYFSQGGCEAAAERRIARHFDLLPDWNRGPGYSEIIREWVTPWAMNVGVLGGLSGAYTTHLTVRCVREVRA